jgi:hypothetical protein
MIQSACRRYFTTVNRKVHCSFTCDSSAGRVLFSFIIPFVLSMQRIFYWCIDTDELVYHRFGMYAAVFLFHLFHTSVFTIHRFSLLKGTEKKRSLFRVGRCSLTKILLYKQSYRLIRYTLICLGEQ